MKLYQSALFLSSSTQSSNAQLSSPQSSIAGRCRTAWRVARAVSAAALVIFTPLVGAAQTTPATPAAPPAGAASPTTTAAPAPAAAPPATAPTTATSPAPSPAPPGETPAEAEPVPAAEEQVPVPPSPAAEEVAEAEAEKAEVAAEQAEEEAEAKAKAAEEAEERENYDGPATLLGGRDEKISLGGYGGITALGTSIDKQAALLLGAEAALLLDHRFAIGVAGFGLSSEIDGVPFSNGDESAMGLGYGGAIMRYNWVCKTIPMAFSFGALVGGGGMTFLRKIGEDQYEYDEDPEDVDLFFVVEPSIQSHVYFTRWMRAGVNLDYRFVSGIERSGYKSTDLSGFAGGAHLQFGWF